MAVHVGCPTETGIKANDADTTDADADADSDSDTDTDTDCPDWRLLECSDASCDVGTVIPMDAVIDCFWDGNSFIPATPPLVSQQCPPGTNDIPTSLTPQCEVVFFVQTIEPVNACVCEDACTTAVGESADSPYGSFVDPSGCCEWDITVLSDQGISAALEADFYGNCQVNPQTVSGWTGWGCVSGGFVPGASTFGDPCPSDAVIGAPGSHFSLWVDAAESYVTITAGTQSLLAPIAGSGAVETSPTKFLRGLFWVDDSDLGDLEFSSWMFFFDHPIDMDVSAGTFRVLPADANHPGIRGRGQVDGSDHQFELRLGNSALGTINPATSTWSLHYQESSDLGTIEVYLEGTVHDLTP